MSFRLCYIPYVWASYTTLDGFKARISDEDTFGFITVRDHPVSQNFLLFLSLHGLDKGLIYKSTEAVSYRYPTLGPRLTLRVYSFKGLL